MLVLLLSSWAGYIATVVANAKDAPDDLQLVFGLIAAVALISDIACVGLGVYYRQMGRKIGAFIIGGVLPLLLTSILPLTQRVSWISPPGRLRRPRC